MHLNTGNCTPGNSLVSFVYGDITPGTLCPPVSLCSLVLGPPDQLSLWEFLTVILEVPWLSVFDPCVGLVWIVEDSCVRLVEPLRRVSVGLSEVSLWGQCGCFRDL